MGCFNLKGFLSRVTISCGDEVVMMLGINKDSGTKIFYTLEKIVPISLPVYGKYNDYGGIDHIKEDNNTKWLEKNIGKLEDIIDKLRNSICVTYSQKEMIERMLLLVNIDKGIKTGLYDDKIAIQYALLKILVVNT